MTILVTGGSGFIGSHLIDRLIEQNHKIICVDDLSLGIKKNIKHHLKSKKFKFIKIDILNKLKIEDVFKNNKIDLVFHFAANSDIQKGNNFHNIDFDKTFLTTYILIELMEKYKVKKIVFPSSSAVFGNLNKKLSEDTGPLKPVSFYGAAKLSSEAYISAFCANSNIQSWIFRFPNVVGERATHGVIFDFINKLSINSDKLQILGDGKQEKPYVYVKDLIQGIFSGIENSDDKFNIFHIGNNTFISVKRIAEIVVEEMGMKNVKFEFTGGKRGWAGDVPKYSYDVSKINKLGWKASMSSEQAIRYAVQQELKFRNYNHR